MRRRVRCTRVAGHGRHELRERAVLRDRLIRVVQLQLTLVAAVVSPAAAVRLVLRLTVGVIRLVSLLGFV